MKTGLLDVLLLLFAVFIVRLPSFFFSVFDWDESTLIIVGQSILDGHMPYVEAWDTKPPFAFYAYALFIALFGKSLISIRLAGLLCIYIASLFLYKAGKAVYGRTAGVISALFLIAFVSSGYSGLSTMTEHLLLLPISFILYLLLTREIGNKLAMCIGLLLGISILIKTNIMFESIAVCILLMSGIPYPEVTISGRLKKFLFFGVGICSPLAIVTSYYHLNNELDLLVKTNITIATALTGIKKLPFSDRGGIFIYNLVSNFKLNPLLWITFLLGMAYLVFARGQVKKILSTTIIILVAQFSSLFLVGHPFGYHYLMTSMPIMCLVSGFFVSKWLSGSKIRKNLNYFATFLLIFGSILYSLQGNVLKYYKEIFSHYTHKQLPRNDSCFKIAKYLTTAGVKDKYIYMVNSCQIVYWLTESRYPTKYIHPSNLFLKEYMLKIIDGPNATKERELLKILGKNPAFIVYRKDLWPVQLESFKTILDEKLHTGYKLINIIDTDYLIYKSDEFNPIGHFF